MSDKKPLEKKKSGSHAASAAFVRYTSMVTGNVLRSMKMAGPEIYDVNTSPLRLLDMLKTLGPASLAWKPETLFARLDETFGGWTKEQVAAALEKFHTTGNIESGVPTVNRHKIYALRIIMTSDTAHHEWHVFEKIGGAFSGRQAHFGVVEPLSPLECAKAISTINAIRPDEFTHEIQAYIAASCHEAGIYTTRPSKYLGFSDNLLDMMNREETGRPVDGKIVSEITNRVMELKRDAQAMVTLPEDFVSIQAARLLAVDAAGDEAAGA